MSAQLNRPVIRTRDAKTTYWGDPHGNQPGDIERDDGGRGTYSTVSDSHGTAVITGPYQAAADGQRHDRAGPWRA